MTGRIKDIILRGGENIAPAEIENVIVQMPEVKEVKVVGIKAQVLQASGQSHFLFLPEQYFPLRAV